MKMKMKMKIIKPPFNINPFIKIEAKKKPKKNNKQTNNIYFLTIVYH